MDTLFGYTGRPYDDETDLQNNRHRWYDSETGRWISQDPIGFNAGDANLYRYVGNGSTGAVDPSGLDEIRRPKSPYQDAGKDAAYSFLDGIIEILGFGTARRCHDYVTAEDFTSGRRLTVEEQRQRGNDIARDAAIAGAGLGVGAAIDAIGDGRRITRAADKGDEAAGGAARRVDDAVEAAAPNRVISRIGDLSQAEREALQNIWDGGPRSQLPLRTREQLAEFYSGVARRNPAGSAQAAFD